MKNRTENQTEIHACQVLEALYDLARADRDASPRLLAKVTGIPAQQLPSLLHELDALGLVDVSHCRLTMPGLVLAACSAGRRSHLQVDCAA